MIEIPEVDRAEWFGLDAAREKINAGQVPLLDRLEALLGSRRRVILAGDRIGPTAHYTGYVWARNGLSHPELSTTEGRVLFDSLQPCHAGQPRPRVGRRSSRTCSRATERSTPGSSARSRPARSAR